MDKLLLLVLIWITHVDVDAQDASDTANDGPIYQFKYHVHDQRTMDYKTHEEIGESGSVRGTYTVREPNGDLRIVSYTAGDDRGFQAMVRVRPVSSTSEEDASKREQPMESKQHATASESPLKIQLHTRRREHRQSKIENITPKAQKITNKKQGALHLKKVQNVPQYGHFYAPVLLHVLPTQHPTNVALNLEEAPTDTNQPVHCPTINRKR